MLRLWCGTADRFGNDFFNRLIYSRQLGAKAHEKGSGLLCSGPSSSLRTFLDLHYLVCHVPMRLAMNGLRRLCVRCLKKAVDLALLLAEPVPKSLSPMLVLDFEVLLVVLGHGFGAQPFQVLVVVH